MSEVYHPLIASQEAYLSKEQIKKSPFRALEYTYGSLKEHSLKLTVSAYDLYAELSFLSFITKKKVSISATDMMQRIGMTRQHAFHAAKNTLLTHKLIKYDDKGFNSCNVYKVIYKPPTSEHFYKVPFAIWNWLLQLLLKKIITPIERHIFLWLFYKWTISGYEKDFLYYPAECLQVLLLTKTTAKRAFAKLENLRLLKRTSSTTRHKPCLATIFIDKNLKYTVRKGHISIDICDDTKTLLNNLKLLQK